MADHRQCPFCFSALEEDEVSCSECRYSPDFRNPKGLLAVGTLLNDRFTIGMVMHHNDLLTTYLAWDLTKERKVRVEEFFPGILKRAEDGKNTLLLSEESKTEFRTLASDLHDRWKRLIPITHKALLKTIVLFSENGTLYRVSEYVKMLSLEEYLREQKQPLTASDVKLLISPVISLVSQLHNMGLTHCGISPENIWLDSRKRVVLDGFALPELRTVGSGLKAELYAGFSAPEQYSKALWQGEWTDIYSIGAVLYRLYSGTIPASAELRGSGKDALRPLSELRHDIPPNLSQSVMKAMEYDKKYRYKSMEQLSAALLEETGANTAVFRPESSSHPQGAKNAAKSSAVLKWVSLGLLLVSLAGNIYFGIRLWENNGDDILPEPEVATVGENFTGYYLDAVKERLNAMTEYHFNYRYDYNEGYPSGVIYKQSLDVGQVLPEDGKITLYVSKGLEHTPMPDLIGANETYAMRILSDLQLQYTVEYDSNYETGGEEGTVIACSVEKGEQVRPKSAENPDTIVITIKKTNSY